MTPLALCMAGSANIWQYWDATLEVLADDLLLRVRRSFRPSTIAITLTSLRPHANAISARCFAALFNARNWHGSLHGEGNAGILSMIDGLRGGSGAAVSLSFSKQIDSDSWLCVESVLPSFEIRAARSPAPSPERSKSGEGDSVTTVDEYLTLVRKGLRSQRLRRGYSLQRMARLCGIPKTTLGDLERGTQRITAAHLYEISLGMGIDMIELVSPQQSENPTDK